ncbi:unnamed protein product [marine sediment metagenome]|uniref:Uncharacterized protein n=1 Tax=marine sediment metagenome TaxID=412755 RepID=X0SU38_9ZZZZ
MKTKLFIISILIIFIVSSGGCGYMCKKFNLFCDDPTGIPVLNIEKDVEKTQKTIKENTTIIKESSDNIIKETESITKEADEAQRKIPQDIKPEIDPHIDSIKESSNSIANNTERINKANINLLTTNSTLEEVKKKAKTSDKILLKITEERDEAIKAKNDQMQKMLRWVIVASIIGAGGLGVFGFMYGNRLSLTLSLVCIVVMSIAIFVSTYLIYIIIFGGIILIALIGLLVYNIIAQKKAFKEVVDTVEIAQKNMPTEARTKLFGGKGQTGIMDGIQSKTTMGMVQKEKNKMSNLWMYAKVNGDENSA